MAAAARDQKVSANAHCKAGTFETVNEKVNFSAEEQKVLKYWNDIKAFETSLKLSEGNTTSPHHHHHHHWPRSSADSLIVTSLPSFLQANRSIRSMTVHHLLPVYRITVISSPVPSKYVLLPLASCSLSQSVTHSRHAFGGFTVLQDTITRYAAMTGHHVERRFGWDCHGLPVEYEIDQKLGIKSKDDVMKMGVAAYNAECRSIVTRYCSEWEERVSVCGSCCLRRTRAHSDCDCNAMYIAYGSMDRFQKRLQNDGS